MRVLLLAPYPPDHAPSQRFRFEQYLEDWRRHGVACEVSPLLDADAYRTLYQSGRHARKAAALLRALGIRLQDARRARRYDAVFIHREAFFLGPPAIEWLIRRAGVPIIFDFDDAIYLPNVSAANRAVGRWKWPEKFARILSWSRVVIAGNEGLAQYARQYAAEVCVIPTTIDTAWYRPQAPRPAGAPVRLGWSGSMTTIDHVRLLEPVFRTLCARYPLQLRVIGDAAFQLSGLPVEALPWRRQTELEDLGGVDIGVMPLPDEDWARGKCGLKALQYMALGIPAVCSPVGVNTAIIEDGVNGLLADSPEAWVAKLSRLIEDAALRQRLGQAGRSTVEMQYSVRVNAPRYLKVFERVSGARLAPASPRPVEGMSHATVH